ncbi:MAG: hypothetical protein P9M15_04550, partial [Candidatus Electryoneaceae bacterium]|nr:hypothetical protein [Candidatus Electryoneaceae bacterium]
MPSMHIDATGPLKLLYSVELKNLSCVSYERQVMAQTNGLRRPVPTGIRSLKHPSSHPRQIASPNPFSNAGR